MISAMKKENGWGGERLRWKGKGQVGRSPSYGKGGVVRTRGKDYPGSEVGGIGHERAGGTE